MRARATRPRRHTPKKKAEPKAAKAAEQVEAQTDAAFHSAWMDQVGELLTLSMQHHDAAKVNRADGNKADAFAHVRTAYQLRKSAHSLDPQHQAPMWAQQQSHTAPNEDTHEALMAFYTQQLGL